MTPRTWAYSDIDDDDMPIKDRPYESFGQQGVGMATYGSEPHSVRSYDAYEAERQMREREAIGPRGAARVDLGEPVARRVPAGPKGWQRRDDRIHDDVCSHLSDDGHVDASDIEVVVHQGEVVLTGTAPDRRQRDRALHIADSVRGVVDVVNRLHVGARAAAERRGGEGDGDV